MWRGFSRTIRIEHKRYRYAPEYDHDNDRAYYHHGVEIKCPGKDIWLHHGHMDLSSSTSPYVMTNELFEMWIEGGMPDRKTFNSIGPITVYDIKRAYEMKVDSILLGVDDV